MSFVHMRELFNNSHGGKIEPKVVEDSLVLTDFTPSNTARSHNSSYNLGDVENQAN